MGYRRQRTEHGLWQHGDDCATGVAFTRDQRPVKTFSMANTWSTRKAKTSWQGCVHRSRSPIWPKTKSSAQPSKNWSMFARTLEKNFGDVQDFEFTIEKKKLYMLQTRNGKRTALA